MVKPVRICCNRALAEVPEGEWWHIISLEDYYPRECNVLDADNTHENLNKIFKENTGRNIAFGRNPLDYESKWIYTTPEEVMVLQLKKHKNQFRQK